MKESVESAQELISCLRRNDLDGVSGWVRRHAVAWAALNAGVGCSPSQLAAIRSTEMVDRLVELGLRLSWVGAVLAPGIGLGGIPTVVAERLVHHGVDVSAPAAAALGLTEYLSERLKKDQAQVHALGGDGCRPLHFARTVEMARMLVENGARLDARDEDHTSTPAQWRIGEAPDVTRYLLEQGAVADVFMAAGLGDLDLARRLVETNPECTRWRIGNNSGPFPGIGFHGRGGTIYQWTLGFNQSPQEIALARGHRDLFDFLMTRTRPRPKLLVACALADRELAESILAGHPGLVAEFDDDERTLLARFCWETNLNPGAVRLMLDLGFPVACPEPNHGYSPLHNAAWCGHAGLVELLIQRGHPLNDRDPRHQATPLDFALHSCLEARRHPAGEFPRVLELLLDAGATLATQHFPTGRADLDQVLQRYQRSKRPD